MEGWVYLLQPNIKGNNVVDVGLDHFFRLRQEADLRLKKKKADTVGIRFWTQVLALAPRPVKKILPVKMGLGPSTKSSAPKV